MNQNLTVLGVNHGGHDTSAALMRSGQLVAACEQERLTLDKHSRRFPVEAIEDCLNQGDISIADVDELAYAFLPNYHIREKYIRPVLEDATRLRVLIEDIDRIQEIYSIEEEIRDKTGFVGEIKFFHHHMCHLASAWYPSGFDAAVVASYDGIGEVESGLLATGCDGTLEVFHQGNRYPDSLGLVYSAVTHYLGWLHHCDEGIIMGLACYGDPHIKMPSDSRSYIDVFREVIRETGDFDYEIDRKWIAYHEVRDKWISDYFCEIFGSKRDPKSEITLHHKNIAAALQLRIEEIVLNQLHKAQQKSGLKKLCLSGGVALNCSLNGRIEQSRIFEEIFVQPASGDAGVAAGACFLAHKGHQPEYRPTKMHNFYLGSTFRTDEIETAFIESGITPTRPDDLYHQIAAKLIEGKIVGWFQGGAEFGPRALGNRSILTRPFPADMKDYLNNRVKFREEFRPFAPAVLATHAKDYFEIQQESPHMLIACKATERAWAEIPATVHVDGTCRVQTVKIDNNEPFFLLLSAFYELTGCPVLLNTSFNVKGQPMVNSPKDAIKCYLSTNIDCLVIEGFFFEK